MACPSPEHCWCEAREEAPLMVQGETMLSPRWATSAVGQCWAIETDARKER
ncbi:hypothetical protein HRbin28_00149 [bacterium HR28]|nr:hypothetical protein HRbin28_00149 [bacterium HR28]